jgi:hypothetical protein
MKVLPASGDFRRKTKLAFVQGGCAKKTLFEDAAGVRVRFRGRKGNCSFYRKYREAETFLAYFFAWLAKK